MTNEFKIRIGTSSSGKPLVLNHLKEEQSTAETLAPYTMEEMAEILCILKFTMLIRIEDDNEYADSKTLDLVLTFLDGLRLEINFSKQLEKMGLRTSVDRVQAGERIAL